MGLTLLYQSKLPMKYWVDAFLTSIFIINRLPTNKLNMESPFLKLFGTNPNYENLRSFGFRCYPYLRNYGKDKFSKKTRPCVFIGYSPMHKGYRCLDTQSNWVHISRHVVFDESQFPFDKTSEETNITAPELVSYTDQEAWLQKGHYHLDSLSNSNSPIDQYPTNVRIFDVEIETTAITYSDQHSTTAINNSQEEQRY